MKSAIITKTFEHHICFLSQKRNKKKSLTEDGKHLVKLIYFTRQISSTVQDGNGLFQSSSQTSHTAMPLTAFQT